VKRLATHFDKPADYYTTVKIDPALVQKMSREKKDIIGKQDSPMVGQSAFEKRNLDEFSSYEEAYHQLIFDIVVQQVRSTNIVLKGTPVKKIFVDGGFSRNPIYMHLMALFFPGIDVYAASVAQATAMGAALVLHDKWNPLPVPTGLVALQQCKVTDGINTIA
jgi:hypothetical protein